MATGSVSNKGDNCKVCNTCIGAVSATKIEKASAAGARPETGKRLADGRTVCPGYGRCGAASSIASRKWDFEAQQGEKITAPSAKNDHIPKRGKGGSVSLFYRGWISAAPGSFT